MTKSFRNKKIEQYILMILLQIKTTTKFNSLLLSNMQRFIGS